MSSHVNITGIQFLIIYFCFLSWTLSVRRYKILLNSTCRTVTHTVIKYTFWPFLTGLSLLFRFRQFLTVKELQNTQPQQDYRSQDCGQMQYCYKMTACCCQALQDFWTNEYTLVKYPGPDFWLQKVTWTHHILFIKKEHSFSYLVN